MDVAHMLHILVIPARIGGMCSQIVAMVNSRDTDSLDTTVNLPVLRSLNPTINIPVSSRNVIVTCLYFCLADANLFLAYLCAHYPKQELLHQHTNANTLPIL